MDAEYLVTEHTFDLQCIDPLREISHTPPPASPERCLLLAIIQQVITDATGKAPGRQRCKWAQEALEWLETDMLEQLAEWAGIDPQACREAVERQVGHRAGDVRYALTPD